jgi:colanic acid biosynthesis protein WcaH
MKLLSYDEFKSIIQLTPLVAFDMIIEYENKILLGKRINEPAKGFYFIPGGRILKNETLTSACKRLTQVEIGIPINLNKFTFHMNTEHIYENNFFNNKFNTHYVCLCYKYRLSKEEFQKINIDSQHDEIKWMSIIKLLSNENVHINTKKYFI